MKQKKDININSVIVYGTIIAVAISLIMLLIYLIGQGTNFLQLFFVLGTMFIASTIYYFFRKAISNKKDSRSERLEKHKESTINAIIEKDKAPSIKEEKKEVKQNFNDDLEDWE